MLPPPRSATRHVPGNWSFNHRARLDLFARVGITAFESERGHSKLQYCLAWWLKPCWMIADVEDCRCRAA